MSDRHEKWTGQEMLFAPSRKGRQRGTGMSNHKELRALCDDVMDQSKRGAYQIYITTVISLVEGCRSLLDEKEHIATLEDELDTRKKALAAYIKNKEKLEAEVERLKKANQHWHDRQPERDAQLKLQEDFEEALDIISMTGVAPKFVEKHKHEERG